MHYFTATYHAKSCGEKEKLYLLALLRSRYVADLLTPLLSTEGLRTQQKRHSSLKFFLFYIYIYIRITNLEALCSLGGGEHSLIGFKFHSWIINK